MTVTLPGVVVGLLREATGITDPVKAAHALADDAIERRLRLHAIEALAEASSYVEANPPYNTSQAMMLTKTLVAKAQKKRAAKKH